MSVTAQFRFPANEQNKIDSLHEVIHNTNDDTTLARSYARLAYIFEDNELDSTEKYCEKAIKIAATGIDENTEPQVVKSFKTSLAWGFLYKALLNIYEGNDSMVVEYTDRSLQLAEELGIQEIIGSALSYRSVRLVMHGDLIKGTDLIHEAINRFKEADAKKFIGRSYTTLALISVIKGDVMNALDELKTGLSISEEFHDKVYIALAHTYYGKVYLRLGDPSTALKHFETAMSTQFELNDESGMINSINSSAAIHVELGNFTKAKDYFEKNLIRSNESKVNAIFKMYSLIGLADIYYKTGEYSKALDHLDKIPEIRSAPAEVDVLTSKMLILRAAILLEKGEMTEAKEIGLKAMKATSAHGIPVTISESALLLNKIYKEEKNWRKANEMYELHVQMRDSTNNQENQQAAMQLKYQHEYEIKKRLDSADHAQEMAIRQTENELDKAKLDNERTLRIALFIGIALILVFLGFILNRFRVSQKQKSIIEKQHDKLDESHNELKDSITYARRLQDAILPQMELVEELLPRSFILYRPKAVVAGDFYWLEAVNDWVYFAVADCTGHGVPGAMVSVVCSNALSKALVEEGNAKPADILNRARELVIDRFARSGENIMDGMDASLCAFNHKLMRLEWSGANNPLWIIRKGGTNIEEIAADRQPIGSYGFETPFRNHEIPLNEGDTIYVFSDGYSDQFGGENSKKYKLSNLRSFLLSIKDRDMKEQCESLSKEFDRWKGENDQIDDVCIMGVRV